MDAVLVGSLHRPDELTLAVRQRQGYGNLMRPLTLLFLLFALIPLAEIYVIIEVGSRVGALATLALILLTAAMGASLVRAQGVTTYQAVQGALQRGELPATEMIEGLCLLVAGALLLTPGFLTDAAGFLLLTPPLRRRLILRYLDRLRRELLNSAGRGDRGPFSGRTYEGEFHRHDDDRLP